MVEKGTTSTSRHASDARRMSHAPAKTAPIIGPRRPLGQEKAMLQPLS